MTTVQLSAFLPYLLPYVPGCLEDSAIIALRHAAIEFCTSTHVLQQDLDATSIESGVSTYDIDADTGYEPVHVISLYYNGTALSKTTQMSLGARLVLDWQTLPGTPLGYTQFRNDQVVLMPTPDADLADGLTGRVAITPTRTATSVDEMLFKRHLDAIVKGALAILMNIPAQPFTDPKGAMDYGVLFRIDIAKTRALVNGGFSRAQLQVQMRPF